MTAAFNLSQLANNLNSSGQLDATDGLVNAVPATNGGTGHGSYAVGDFLFASTSSALSRLADVATGNALLSGGVGVAPAYGKVGLTTHVSGTLPVASGGTGVATLALNNVVLGNGTGAVTGVAPGTSGNVLTSNGTTWASAAVGGVVTTFNTRSGAVTFLLSDYLASLGAATAGTNYHQYGVSASISAGGSPIGLTELLNFRILVSGVLTVKFSASTAPDGSENSRIYKNGVAAGTLRNTEGGTFAENISVTAQDTIQFFAATGAFITNTLSNIGFGTAATTSIGISVQINVGQR